MGNQNHPEKHTDEQQCKREPDSGVDELSSQPGILVLFLVTFHHT